LSPNLSIEGVREFVFDVYPLAEIDFPIYARFGTQQGLGLLPCSCSTIGNLKPGRWQTVHVNVDHTRSTTDNLRFDLFVGEERIPDGKPVRFIIDNLRFVPEPKPWTVVPIQSLSVRSPLTAGYLESASRKELADGDNVGVTVEVGVRKALAGTLIIDMAAESGKEMSFREKVALQPPYTTLGWTHKLTADQIVAGKSVLRVRIVDEQNEAIASAEPVEIQLYKFADMEVRRTTLLRKLDVLNAAMGASCSPLARVDLTVARMFLEKYIVDDFVRQKQYAIATEELNHVDRLLLQAEEKMKAARVLSVADYDPNAPVVVADGRFIQNGKPFLMVGPLDWEFAKTSIPLVRDLGFNSVVVEVRLGETSPEYWQLAAKHGIAAHLLLGSHYFVVPKKFEGKFDDLGVPGGGHVGLPYNVLSPGVREIVKDWYRENLEPIKNSNRLVGLCTANEPGYSLPPNAPRVPEAFRSWVRSQYKTMGEANARWHTSFSDFDHIDVKEFHKRIPASPAVRYDWETFVNDAVARYFGFLQQEVRGYLPSAQVHVKVIGDLGFSYLDEEDIYTKGETVHGTDGVGPMWLDFLKSIDPAKPVVNSEWHFFGASTGNNPGHMARCMFEGVAHGIGAGLIWQWCRFDWDSQTCGGDQAMTRYPLGLAAMGEASLKLRHLYPILSQFPQLDGGQVRLVYAKASHLHQDESYAKSVSGAYEKLSANASGVRFIIPTRTEKLDPLRVRFIAMANAAFLPAEFVERLEKWVLAGGVLWADEPIALANPWGEPLTGRLSEIVRKAGEHALGAGKVIVQSDFSGWQSYLAGPIARKADGSISRDVECRWASLPGGAHAMYLMNRTDKPQIVSLTSWPTSPTSTPTEDLWSGGKVSLDRPVDLAPYQVMVFTLRP